MRILVDTNVLLDVALARQPHLNQSAEVLRWAEQGGEACVASHSLANCAYLLKDDGRVFLKGVLAFMQVAPVGTHEAQVALKLPMSDLEDAMQVSCALSWQTDLIISRNAKDFRRSPVPAVSPRQFLAGIS